MITSDESRRVVATHQHGDARGVSCARDVAIDDQRPGAGRINQELTTRLVKVVEELDGVGVEMVGVIDQEDFAVVRVECRDDCLFDSLVNVLRGTLCGVDQVDRAAEQGRSFGDVECGHCYGPLSISISLSRSSTAAV